MMDEIPQVDRDACVDLTLQLVRLPSPSGEEGPVATALADRLRRAGAEVTEVAPANVFAIVRGDQPGPRRLFLTHTDTMAPGQMTDPLDAKVVDGAPFGIDGSVVRGLGAAAPKGAVAAMVTALEATLALRPQLRGSVALGIATKDLWADHAGVRELDRASVLDADWVVAGEPSGNRLVLGARGIAQVSVTIAGRAAHWGRPQDAANPIFGIADVASAIRAAELPSHSSLGSATMSPFEVTTEAAPPHSPHVAALRADRRILPDEDPGAVLESIRALADDAVRRTPGLTMELQRDRMMNPFQIAADHPLVEALRARVAAATGSEPETTYITFSSNAGYTTAEKGWPSVAFGPGEITALGPDEHVATQQLGDAANAYAAMMTVDWAG